MSCLLILFNSIDLAYSQHCDTYIKVEGIELIFNSYNDFDISDTLGVLSDSLTESIIFYDCIGNGELYVYKNDTLVNSGKLVAAIEPTIVIKHYVSVADTLINTKEVNQYKTIFKRKED